MKAKKRRIAKSIKAPLRAKPKPARKVRPKRAIRSVAKPLKKPARKPLRAPAPQRQLILIEEKKPPMVVAPAPPPAIVPPLAAPALAKPAQPSVSIKPQATVTVAPQEPPNAPPHIDASGPTDGPLAIPLAPALDMLPEWEDRLRLKRAIFEDGLAFFSLGRHCPEFIEASSMLAQSGKASGDDVSGYFIVCLKDRAGRMVGAMDGHMLENGVMSIGRSAAKGEKRRELHILLYSAALSGHQPSYIIFYTKKTALSEDAAALLILLGRGFGFSAIPAQLPDRLLLIRRVKHELDPISNGQEISGVLGAAKPVLGSAFEMAIAETAKRGIMPLIPLPTSPDSREHLHELRDVVSMLGISADNLDGIIERLRVDYVLGRKDITPEIIS